MRPSPICQIFTSMMTRQSLDIDSDQEHQGVLALYYQELDRSIIMTLATD
ncbi:hypothetical protein N7326_06490 [Corynebacterium sp. ES2794-CONJ1]|nr:MULTISPECIES: hypothetical protein [unclassified Corynebacterium]MCS4490176.1 hypothetical protein [Corynebacterium sp. ES2775-CONJ]MCU9519519.1 hypothetical protein [Corynebacterium sp. ES2794-CONJ1]